MVFAVFPEVTPCDSDKIQLLGYRTKKMALAQLVREWLIISALLKLWTIQAQILGMASEPTPMSRLIHPMPRVIWVERRCSAIIMFAWLFNLDFCSFWNWSYIDCRLLEFEPYNSFFLLNVRLFAFEELRTVAIFYIWNPNIYIYIHICSFLLKLELYAHCFLLKFGLYTSAAFEKSEPYTVYIHRFLLKIWTE